jgi:hypothetical protein
LISFQIGSLLQKIANPLLMYHLRPFGAEKPRRREFYEEISQRRWV